jgi:peptidase E
MTKFILHGGFTRVDNELNAGYYHEITRSLAKDAKVLVIPFSRDDKEYSDVLKLETEKIQNSATNKQLDVQIASENNLIDQIKNSDAVVIRGGNTNKLLTALKKHPSFKDAIKDKTVAGSSAGAYVLSTYYHSADSGKIHEGLKILPLRVICHFKSDQFNVTEKAIKAMDQYPNNLELLVLKDHEWKVFNQQKN